MAIFFIERASFVIANATIEPFFGRIEQKHALSGSFYQRHPIDYKTFIYLGQPLNNITQVRAPLRGSARRAAGRNPRRGFPRLANAANPSMPPHCATTERFCVPAALAPKGRCLWAQHP